LFQVKADLMQPTCASRCQSGSEVLFSGWQANCNGDGMARETILLVEDDLAVSRALEHALKVQRYCVIPADDRQQALRELAHHHIDIALLDLNLGSDCGWETFHHLRHFRPRLPIIVMSARPDQFSHASACLAAGLLEKPFDVRILFRQLATLSADAASRLTHNRTAGLPSVSFANAPLPSS
jgi:DNA-binding response OmpR family regulator